MSATTPCRAPSSPQMARCSRVWGITPSSAATTRSTRSIPCAPATIVRTKRWCPGTSTTPTRPPDGSVQAAKPSSIVIPRRFSSASRSGSVPVRASTSDDFPWSTCPAVPTTRFMTLDGSADGHTGAQFNPSQ